jgi:hypothetical protein
MEQVFKEIPGAYFWLADLYAHVGDMNRCKICYLKAYAHTENPSCLYQLALAFKKTGKQSLLVQAKIYAAKAISAYEEKIGGRSPQVELANELYAKICIQMGNITEAYSVLKRAHSQNHILLNGLKVLCNDVVDTPRRHKELLKS